MPCSLQNFLKYYEKQGLLTSYKICQNKQTAYAFFNLYLTKGA